MTTAAILQLLTFAISSGPEVYQMVVKLIASIQRQFKTDDERVQALQAMLELLTPMEKE